MVELSLCIGEEVNMLEATMFMQSFTSMLKWCFLIVVVMIIAKYIRKENAIHDKKKHSQTTKRKGR